MTVPVPLYDSNFYMSGAFGQGYRTNPQQVYVTVSRIEQLHELEVLAVTNKESFVTHPTDNFTLFEENLFNLGKIKIKI